MTDILVPSLSGNFYPAWAHNAADRFLAMTKEKPMWEVLDMIVEVWMKKNISDSKKLLDEVLRLRATRLNKFAANSTGHDLGGHRHLGEIPQEVQRILDIFYDDEIERMGPRNFYYQFFTRYPIFRVAEKL